MQKNFHMEEVPWQREHLTPEDPNALPQATFVAPTAKGSTTFPFSGLAGVGEPTWPSPSPAGHGALAYEMAAMMWAHTFDQWPLLRCHWFCLLASKGLLVRHRGLDQWFFSLGSCQGHALCFSKQCLYNQCLVPCLLSASHLPGLVLAAFCSLPLL